MIIDNCGIVTVPGLKIQKHVLDVQFMNPETGLNDPPTFTYWSLEESAFSEFKPETIGTIP